VANKIKLHTASEFGRDCSYAGSGWRCDALDAILQKAFLMDHNLAFTGGNENLKYRLSVWCSKHRRYRQRKRQKKYSTNLNVTQEFFDHKLKISSSIIASMVNDMYAPISTSAVSKAV